MCDSAIGREPGIPLVGTEVQLLVRGKKYTDYSSVVQEGQGEPSEKSSFESHINLKVKTDETKSCRFCCLSPAIIMEL
jgi:hypothetical protein